MRVVSCGSCASPSPQFLEAGVQEIAEFAVPHTTDGSKGLSTTFCWILSWKIVFQTTVVFNKPLVLN